MRILSYVKARYEDGSFTGVSRFDFELRRVFPELVSVTSLPSDLDPSKDIVITDNHLSVTVPDAVKTVVVHHGCARTHYERDPQWRTPSTEAMVSAQREMFKKPNRLFVAPSLWVKEQFAKDAGDNEIIHLPHYVDTFGPVKRKLNSGVKPIVIGDWRDFNKGSDVVRRAAGRVKNVEFRRLNFPAIKEAREKFYLEADLYLCLSLSEGAPYSVADAEACGLRIVTTDVGYVRELKSPTVIPWGKRDDPDVVVYWVRKALERVRTAPSFYASMSLESWAEEWHDLVDSFWFGRRRRSEVVSEAAVVKVEGEPVHSVAVSLAGGIGNAVFNLPLLAALKQMGKHVVACVGTDSPTASLWKGCRFIDEVVESVGQIPKVDARLSGPWCVEGFKPSPGMWSQWAEKTHHKPEWELILELASKLGWLGSRPDVSGWHCGTVLQSCRHRPWSVAIVPGCKPEKLWERKRYPYMVDVARMLVDRGENVVWIGGDADRPESKGALPGEELFGKYPIHELPAALSSAAVVLGTDSGPTHLAASLGIATVVVYTATSPVKGEPVGPRFKKIYRPLACSPCQSTPRWKKCENWICREVDPNAVFSATLHLLNEERSADA